MTPSISEEAKEWLYRLIRERRSIRRFTDQPVAPESIERLLEAACWAPSAHNRQPWRFVVLVGEAQKRRLADAMADRLAADLRADQVDEAMVARDTGRSRQRISGAPVVIVVCLSMIDMDQYPDVWRQSFEHQMAAQGVAMAAENLMLAAHAEGLGTCWMCAPLFCQNTVRECLVLPQDFEPQGLILLGHPAESPHKTREPLEEKVAIG